MSRMIKVWESANRNLKRTLKERSELNEQEMSCSVEAFNKFVEKELKDGGRPKDQVLAIAYSKLKKACGVETDQELTPSEIVSRG